MAVLASIGPWQWEIVALFGATRQRLTFGNGHALFALSVEQFGV